MKSLSDCINEMMPSLGVEAQKALSIKRNNAAYKDAVKGIWKDDDARKLIFEHTNAFYVRVDDKPKKGFDPDKPYVVCEVCIDDPLVRSEIDTHRELLQFALRSNGLAFEELKIIPSRRGMKNRHPFI